MNFDDDISQEEKKYYLRAYPNVNMIADRRVHCTSCDEHIGTAPASEKKLRAHPTLRVTQCKRCDIFYRGVDFDRRNDAREVPCRWCGREGKALRCTNCSFAFCRICILQNFSHTTLQNIKRKELWECFACATESIWPQRALHWALENFLTKQKL